MNSYPSIESMFKRDASGEHFILGAWRTPEFAYLANNEWVWTEKIDGMNIRIMWDGTNITFGGRTDKAQIPDPLIKYLMDCFPPTIFSEYPPLCLYGEGYGGKIQKGYLYRPTPGFILFDTKIDGWWLERANVEDIANKLNIDIVPIVGKGSLMEALDYVSTKVKSTIGQAPMEGLVLRPSVELFTRRGDRVITKVKVKDIC